MAGAKKTVAAEAAPQPGEWLARVRRAFSGRGSLALVACLVALAVAGSYALWVKVRGDVLSSTDYHLSPREIEITPLPKWIRSDIKSEVIRFASLESSLSVLDDDLTMRVAQAFELHPWVAKVERVYKEYPARVVAELVYRKPVAMVEVVTGSEKGLVPVDVFGVLLPSEDFSPAEARAFPRIAGIATSPLRPVGAPWGDAQVVGATQIARALTGDWRSLRLAQILPLEGQGVRRAADGQFELRTQRGTRIFWGRAPGNARADELSAAEKVARLVQYAAKNGSLDKQLHPGEPLDLRSAVDRAAAPAIRSLPERDELQ